MSHPRVLLVNPPIYDFAAYDFWLKPYGMLSAAGQLRGKADFACFDYLDRRHEPSRDPAPLPSDSWGRGRFPSDLVPTPGPLRLIRRYFRRFGRPRELFRDFLRRQGPFDSVWIQTVMTYWYLGVAEVIEDIRQICGSVGVVLGGNYVTLCGEHAATLGADLLVGGADLGPLWGFMGLEGDPNQPALWEVYREPGVGVLKLTDGCPFNCTYCSVPRVYGRFERRPLGRVLAELDLLVAAGVRNVAFYDDALLFDWQAVLLPLLEEVIRRGVDVNFHTPNALNARFITPDVAALMVRGGFKTFYVGFESQSRRWQRKTGGKVYGEEFAAAVGHLLAAGAAPANITAYQILGHPNSDTQELEESMRFVRSQGVRGMLADFSPIPGTPDGDACARWVDMAEPLMHNNTAFTILRLGFDESNRLKDLQRRLNRTIAPAGSI